MPMFIIISGYLFEKKIKLPISKTCKKLFRRLIIPNIIWGVALSLITLSFSPGEMLNAFWFLYALFVVSILYLLLLRIIKIQLLTIVIASILTMLLPGCEYIKFITPFFGIGLLFGNLHLFDRNLSSYILPFILFIIGILVYYLFWEGNEYIYITKNPDLFEYDTIKYKALLLRLITGTTISTSIIILLGGGKQPNNKQHYNIYPRFFKKQSWNLCDTSVYTAPLKQGHLYRIKTYRLFSRDYNILVSHSADIGNQ